MGTVIILYYVVIPLGKYKNKLILKYPDSSFFATNLAILLLFPYAESGLSILFGRWMGITGEAGFSGIVYAILAYILFLFLKIGYDLILTKQQQRSQPLGDPIVILIFVAIVAIIAPIYAIFLEMGNHQVNIFGHFAGYSLGLVISASMAIIYETDEERLKIFSLSVLGISLLFSTLCWLIIT
jgi:membrane associated rhomboid family serine protease